MAENTLIGQKYSEAAIRAAMAALAAEFSPLSDLRASKEYRLAMMQNRLWRFYLETNATAPISAADTNVYAAF